jgi:antimicrobial peptide system SdpA family protein
VIPNDPVRRLGALALGLGAFALALGAYAIHGSMPYNPVDLPGESALQVGAWAPEGWKFFTRNPQEETAHPYIQRDGAWVRAASPSGSPKYAFGLDRSGRAEGIEMGLIAQHLPKSAYKACGEDEEPVDCLAHTRGSLRVKNESPNPTLCGQVAIVMQRPAPWAWAQSGRKITMPARAARIEVTC